MERHFSVHGFINMNLESDMSIFHYYQRESYHETANILLDN